MIGMSKYKRILPAIGLCCLILTPAVFAINIKVAKSGGDFSTITAAIKAAMSNDVITILDKEIYEENVTFDSTRNNITLTTSDPTALTKPTIKYTDQTHVGPRTYAESQDNSKIDFDQNGALRLIKTHNIIIDGVGIDGGGAKPFGHNAIWEQRFALQHGNAAVCLWVSSDCIIRNCDITNAYFGLAFKDRNLGGIFANPNPADLDTMNNVPLSGFGLTGNHLVERNRIHNNSFGLYSESAWDQGTTIRYNLIYENHHADAAMAALVKGLTDEGVNQVGGAFFFKDQQLCPWAIYNNTLWHNFLIFAGHWQAGYQHLVFNNIFGPPFKYWDSYIATFGNSMELTPSLVNRIYACVYSAQQKAPEPNYTIVINNMGQIQGAGGAAPEPGTLLAAAAGSTQGFPASADNHWLEMTDDLFLSVNPASTSFLEPNWDNEYVKSVIVQKGWQAPSGNPVVKNTDGTRADLGAIEQAHGKPSFIGTIKPLPLPLVIKSDGGHIQFVLSDFEGTTMTDPVIKLFRLVRISYKAGSFGPGVTAIMVGANDMTMLTPPTTPPVRVGPNTYTIPAPSNLGDYAFIEMIIEATGADGNKFTTAVGFIPYRKLEYTVKVEVLDKAGAKVLSEVRVGDTVTLRCTPQKIDGTAFTKPLSPFGVTLLPLNDLLTPGATDLVPLKYPSGIPGGPDTKLVVFTKIPEGNIENIDAAGIYKNPGAGSYAFLGGTSVKVLSGPPEKVMFVEPPSRKRTLPPKTLGTGFAYPCSLVVYDRFGNLVNTPGQVVVRSIMPDLANVVGGTPGNPEVTIATDSAGGAAFKLLTTNNAHTNDFITIIGHVVGKTENDSADMIVGERAEHLVIFYGDTMLYTPTAELRGQVGERLQIIVIATKSKNPTIDSVIVFPAKFTISGKSPSLRFFDSPTAITETKTFTLVNGRVTLWVTSTDTLNNSGVSLGSDNIIPGDRDQIYFTRPIVTVDSAFYYDSKGFGSVDSVEIFFKAPLTMISDSIALFWPSKVENAKKVIPGTDPSMKLSADSMHITINLGAKAFPPEITGATSFTEKLGITYNKPNNNPGVQETPLSFIIQDKVGPLIMNGATFIERLTPGPGIDTFYVTFSEIVRLKTLTGEALELIQNGTKSKLTILSANPLGSNKFKLVVSSTTTKPQIGDSLRINPIGAITDSLGNLANLNNRPVLLQMKSIPGGIDMAYYLDNEVQVADGVVDTVKIKFNKKIYLSDIDLSLEWSGGGGSMKAEHLTQSLMSYIGGDSTFIQVSVKDKFGGAIKTSGSMIAMVKYNSLNETRTGNVVDSAAPVLVYEAQYYPGAQPINGNSLPDSLFISFSEAVTAMDKSFTHPIVAMRQYIPYTIDLIIPNALVLDAAKSNNVDKFTYKFEVKSVSQFPRNGDTASIDPAAMFMDVMGAIQRNPKNHWVPIHVFPIPYGVNVQIVENPVIKPDPGHPLVIKVTPDTKMIEQVDLTFSGQIFDGIGNILHTFPDQKFDRNSTSDQGLIATWDCVNKNKRNVGSGVYILSMVIKKNGQVYKTPITKIGVKR
jgi:hypothetical protein